LLTYILFFLAMLMYAIYTVVSSKRQFHMLQLSGYHNAEYIKWFFTESRVLRPSCFLPFASVIFALLGFFNAFLICLAAMYFIASLIQPKIIQKKKFVYTARVKRQYAAFIAVMGAIIAAAAAALFKSSFVLCTAIIMFAVAISGFKFIYPVLANIISLPAEKAVQRYYINDAKAILKKRPDLVTIGITGSYGKTSVKFIMQKFLSQKYNVLMTPESYNTPMGIVKTIRMLLQPAHQIFICEMGAKVTGEIKELCDIVHPQHGLITSIGMQHLETFKSLQNIIDTKFELVDAIPKDTGKAFLNFENENIARRKTDKNVISYGLNNPNLMYWASDIAYAKDGISFTLNSQKGVKVNIATTLLGNHNVINIVGAAAVALEFGVKPEDIAYAARKLVPVPHRLELKRISDSLTMIDDAFNSNPNGAKEAVNVLSTFTDAVRILVTPGFIELGSIEHEENYKLGAHAAGRCDYLIAVGDEKRREPICKGAIDAGFDKNKVFALNNLREALELLYKIDGKNKVALFENDLPDHLER